MTDRGPLYVRQKTRIGPVPASTKFFQAIGALPETYKNYAFNTFLLLYYNQILGLPAVSASLAIGVALVIDAACDPLIGSFSDGLRSRLGRRHPLMYAAAAPMALGLFLSFSPPVGMAHAPLLVWLFLSVCLTNIATSLFVLPWSALFAEFSDDYLERTKIVTWRFAVGALGGLAFTVAVLTLVFRSAGPGHPGQLNPTSYHLFGPVLAVSVFAAIVLTTFLTRRDVPYLMQPVGPIARFGVGRTLREVGSALKNPDFRILFLCFFLASGIIGAQASLDIYLQTWFWGLGPKELSWLVLSIVGAFAGFAFAGPLQARFDKNRVMLTSFALLLADGMIIVALRLLGLMPENGSPALLPILVVNEIARTFIGVVLWIMVVSMFADTMDAQELRTGARQEGVFSAALSFSAKATTGVGTVIGGFLLTDVIRWPAHALPGHVAHHMLVRLGVMDGLVLSALYIAPFLVCLGYSITRERHAAMRAELDVRRLRGAPSPPADEIGGLALAEARGPV